MTDLITTLSIILAVFIGVLLFMPILFALAAILFALAERYYAAYIEWVTDLFEV